MGSAREHAGGELRWEPVVGWERLSRRVTPTKLTSWFGMHWYCTREQWARELRGGKGVVFCDGALCSVLVLTSRRVLAMGSSAMQLNSWPP